MNLEVIRKGFKKHSKVDYCPPTYMLEIISKMMGDSFKAGRTQDKIENWECENPADWYYFRHKTFNDYLKSKENE